MNGRGERYDIYVLERRPGCDCGGCYVVASRHRYWRPAVLRAFSVGGIVYAAEEDEPRWKVGQEVSVEEFRHKAYHPLADPDFDRKYLQWP